MLSEGFGQTTETWPEFGLPGSEPAVDESVFAAVRRLEERGAQVSEVSVPEHYHGLRLCFASRALALRETLPMIVKLLGHSDIETTARYAHLAREAVKASASRLRIACRSGAGNPRRVVRARPSV